MSPRAAIRTLLSFTFAVTASIGAGCTDANEPTNGSAPLTGSTDPRCVSFCQFQWAHEHGLTVCSLASERQCQAECDVMLKGASTSCALCLTDSSDFPHNAWVLDAGNEWYLNVPGHAPCAFDDNDPESASACVSEVAPAPGVACVTDWAGTCGDACAVRAAQTP